jgi:hypothetical protein
MASESRHLSVSIDRPAAEVYQYASQPTNLPNWARGLGAGIEKVDGQWVVESPGGPVVVALAEPNEYGVLDHDVTFASGETFYNPMRVLADGSGSEVVFTLRRLAGMSDAEFDRDTEAVSSDLRTLKHLVEGE